MYLRYESKTNSHKFIEVKRYKCGHYVWKQYIIAYNMNGTRNYTGCTLKNVHKGVWRRVNKSTMLDVLNDYNLVFHVEH